MFTNINFIPCTVRTRYFCILYRMTSNKKIMAYNKYFMVHSSLDRSCLLRDYFSDCLVLCARYRTFLSSCFVYIFIFIVHTCRVQFSLILVSRNKVLQLAISKVAMKNWYAVSENVFSYLKRESSMKVFMHVRNWSSTFLSLWEYFSLLEVPDTFNQKLYFVTDWSEISIEVMVTWAI